MYYIIAVLVILTYLIYKLVIVPWRVKASYVKMFRDKGYKVYEMPYNFLAAPYIEDWFQNQKTKNDCSYTFKHIYSDSYDVLVSNIFTRPEVIFFNQKLIKAYHDKDLQMKLPKFNVGYQILSFMMKRGLVFIEKDVWRHRRRILSKIFNFQFIATQIPVMVRTLDMIFQKFEEEYWQQHSEDKKEKKIKVTLYELIAKYTSSIVMAGFLGIDSMKQQLKGKTIQDEIFKLTDQSLKLSRDPLNMMFGQKFLKLGLRKKDRDFIAYNKQVNQILDSYIKKYREQHKNKQQSQGKYKTIIELVLQQIQKQSKTQNKEAEVITDQDLVDDIKTFVIAGTETTANYLTMLLLYIHQNKEALERLREEISAHIKSDEDITLENMKKIKFLDCVIAQGSRLFGATEGGFQRVLVQDTVICDIPFKKGTCLNLHTRPLFNSPHIFEDPLAFKPQRWSAQTEQNKHLLQLISLQFYGGPRGCLGKHLALTQTRVGIIKFLRRYKNLVEPQRQNRRFQVQLTVQIANSQVQLQLNI